MASQLELMRMLVDAGGVANAYPFIETGNEQQLKKLESDGLVTLSPGKHGFDRVCVTPKGREFVKESSSATISSACFGAKMIGDN